MSQMRIDRGMLTNGNAGCMEIHTAWRSLPFAEEIYRYETRMNGGSRAGVVCSVDPDRAGGRGPQALPEENYGQGCNGRMLSAQI